MKQALLAMLTFLTLISCAPKQVADTSAPTSPVETAPPKVFESFDAFEPVLRLTDGKIHVVNFWATWCKPCVAELPHFEQLHKKYKDKNVEVLLVSLDNAKKLEQSVVPFLHKGQYTAKVVLLDDADFNAWIDKVNKGWSGAIPATYIYKDGKSAFFEHDFTYEALEAEVQRFIK